MQNKLFFFFWKHGFPKGGGGGGGPTFGKNSQKSRFLFWMSPLICFDMWKCVMNHYNLDQIHSLYSDPYICWPNLSIQKCKVQSGAIYKGFQFLFQSKAHCSSCLLAPLFLLLWLYLCKQVVLPIVWKYSKGRGVLCIPYRFWIQLCPNLPPRCKRRFNVCTVFLKYDQLDLL